MTTTARFRLPAAFALSAALLLGACGGSDDDSAAGTNAAELEAVADAAAAAEGAGEGGDLESAAPEACKEAFPIQIEAPSLDDATMMPEGWADAPEGATLCGVSTTLDDSVQVIDYVTDLAGDDVLAHYEDGLGDDFEVERTEGSLGQPALAGTDPTGASFEIEPGESTFTVTFAVA